MVMVKVTVAKMIENNSRVLFVHIKANGWDSPSQPLALFSLS